MSTSTPPAKARPCPRVSIITPCYNASKYLPALLSSVRAMRWPNIEHVLIDDGSEDEGATLNLLRQTEGIIWRSRLNRGQYATINEALQMITGDVVTIISADDFYSNPEVVECAMANLAEGGSRYDAVYGRTRYVNQDGQPLTCQPPTWQPEWMLPYRFPFSHCSLFIKAEFLQRSGLPWEESLRYVGDAVWIMELLKRGMRVKKVPSVFADYRLHTMQISASVENPRRDTEHKAFDNRYGVNPAVDRVVNGMLSIRRRLIHGFTALRGRSIVA